MAWKNMADGLGIYFDEEINNRLRGVSRMESLEIILERSDKKYSDKEKEEFANKKNELYKELLNEMSEKDLDKKVKDTLDILKERGYKTREDYNIYWDFLEKNNCRMYSDSRRTERLADLPWMDYVPDNFEKDILFEREKTYTIEKKNGNIFCKGYLSDTYHEMLTLIKIDSEGIITENKIKIIRAPGVSCFTNDENNNSLMGRKLSEISKRDIISALGGCDGCYHIVEMYIDSHRVLTEKR